MAAKIIWFTTTEKNHIRSIYFDFGIRSKVNECG